MKIIKYLLVICISLYSAHSLSAQYHFSSIERLSEQKVAAIVLTEIYRQLGITIKISPYPANRAQYEANSGIKAGEILRIGSYGDESPNLIRVPTPYYQLVTTAFINQKKEILLNENDDLSKYRLARVRGVKHTNNITQDRPFVYDSPSTKAMFLQLEKGFVDIALTNYNDGMYTLLTMPNTNIIAYPKQLAVFNLYHYIHKQHAHLVKLVDDKIKQLKESGELQKIIDKAEKEIL